MQNALFPICMILAIVVVLLIIALYCLYAKYRRTLLDFHTLHESTEQTKSDLVLALEAGNMSVWSHDLATDCISFLKKDFTKSDPIPLVEHFKLKHPNDMAVCKEAMDEMLSGKADKSKIIYHYVDSSVPGGYRIIESFITPKYEDGKVVEMIGVEHDVTKERMMLNELELSKKKSNLAIETSGIISFELDIHTSEVTIVNLYGKMAVRRMPLSTCINYVYEPDRKGISDVFYDMIMNGKKEPFHLHFRAIVPKLDGIQFCTMHGNALELGSNARPTSYIGFITNQTPYVEMNKKLTWASRHNRLILDNVNCGLLYVDKDYHILWDNIERVFPNTNVFEGICSGGKFCYCASEKHKPGMCDHCLLKKCLETNAVISEDYTLSDGREVEIQMIPVVDDGQSVGAVCRLDDVTSRKKVVRDLEEARLKAEASSRLKTTFLANMGHEIRTPLNAITGFASLLNDASEQDRNAYIQIINENGTNLTRLIENLLELSNLECGEIQLSREPIYLPSLVDAMVSNYCEKVPDGIEVVSDYNEDLTIQSDPNRIQEVLDNFMSNAMKYTKEGRITVGFKLLDDKRTKVFVSDTGIGIPEEKHSRVFHRFEKLGSMVQGNGLGLSICKAIMDACGGEIGYESKVGQGSTFWFIV